MTTMKNSEIEVLRGIAIVMAVAAHFNGFLFPGGVPFTLWLDQYVFFGVGVDLFFCISGFVVSKSLIPIVDLGPDFSTKWLAIKAFWTRRVYRLLPAAWFWALFGLVCSMFFSAERFSTPLANLKSIIAIATFFGNIGQYLTGALGPNVAYWSLALEEQFYFLFPFFLLLVAGPTRWVALAGLIALQFMISRDSNIWWWIRFDGLTWGVLLYLFSTTKWHEKCRLKIFSVGWVRISLLLLALYIISALPKLGVSVAYGLVALVCAALVFLASYHAGYIPGGRSALFAWLGLAAGHIRSTWPTFRLIG